MIIRILWLCALSSLSFHLYSENTLVHKGKRKITLEEALKLVLESRHGFETMEKRIRLVDHRVKDIDKTFDPTISFNNVYGYDNEHKGGSFTPIQKGQGFDSTVEYSQLFPTGTQLRAALGLGYKSAPLADGVSASPFAAAYQGYESNKATSKIEVELSQALLKSSKMLKLQREMIGMAKITPEFKKQILAQSLQYEIEVLFVNHTYLSKQLSQLEKTKETLEAMRALTKKLISIGQADELALAKSEYQLLTTNVRIDSLSLEKEQLARVIISKCDLPLGFEYELEEVSYKGFMRFKKSGEAIHYALGNRLDLQEKEALKAPLQKKIAYIKEEYKPDVNFFVRYTGNSEEVKFADSFVDTLKQKHPKVAVGLNIKFKLGSASYKNEYQAKRLEIEVLESEKQDLISSLSRDLELDYFKIEKAKKKREMNELKMKALEKQLILEKEKFAQARGGKASLLRYDLDKQAIEIENLGLFKEEELTLRHIKFLTHSY